MALRGPINMITIAEPIRLRLPQRVMFQVTRADGKIEEPQICYNKRTDAGASAIAQLIGSAAGLPFLYVGLSADTTLVAKTDTTLTSEYTTNGLGRKLVAYGGYVAPSVVDGVASFTESASWTCTAAAQSINKIAAFTALSAGTMGFATILAATTVLNNGDVGNLVWSFNC